MIGALALPEQPASSQRVAAGLDEVADAGRVAVPAERHPVLGDAAEPDELGPDIGGEPSGVLVGADDEDRPAARQCVGEPGSSGRPAGLLGRAGVDQPTVLAVLEQDRVVAVP